jgi:hypothetical protein
MSGLKEHHRKWLESHTGRTEEWLAEKLMDGFDIHHIDGNCENNDAENIVLIECSDHLLLHGGRLSRIGPVRTKRRSHTEDSGRIAYERRVRERVKWYEIGGDSARLAAQRYARKRKLPWPPLVFVSSYR